MIKHLAVASAFITLASPAFAADAIMPATGPAPAPAPVIYNWSGPYAGVQAGYVWGDDDLNIPNYQPAPFKGHSDGGLLGAFAGYNYQWNRFVLGAELGINWVDASETIPTLGTETFHIKQNWEGSIVGRIGVPVDNLLLYGLGGASFTHITGNYSNLGVSAPTASDTVAGFTLGVGAEYKFTPSIGGRLEYRYANYGTANVTCSICGPTSVDLITNTITVGAVFHF